MGPQAEGLFETWGRFVNPVGTAGGKPRGAHLYQMKVRVGVEEPGHSALIFLRGKGTGGVDQTAAGPQHHGGGFQNLILPPGAHQHRLHAPVGHGGGLLAEHALTGTGRIHQNAVKIAGEPLLQPFGVFVEHQGVGAAHALQILAQDSGPFRLDLIGDQKPLTVQQRRQLGRLAAGGGAQVQNGHTGPHIQQPRRCHGAGLLQVVCARIVVGRQTGAGVGIIIIAVRRPGHRLAAGDRWQFFQRVEPQSHGTGPLGGFQKRLQTFRPDEPLHTA